MCSRCCYCVIKLFLKYAEDTRKSVPILCTNLKTDNGCTVLVASAQNTHEQWRGIRLYTYHYATTNAHKPILIDSEIYILYAPKWRPFLAQFKSLKATQSQRYNCAGGTVRTARTTVHGYNSARAVTCTLNSVSLPFQSLDSPALRRFIYVTKSSSSSLLLLSSTT